MTQKKTKALSSDWGIYLAKSWSEIDQSYRSEIPKSMLRQMHNGYDEKQASKMNNNEVERK